MRSTLLGELDGALTSTHAFRRPPRTSESTRNRFHQSLSNSSSQSKQTIQNHASYSTKSSIKRNEPIFSPFVPTLYSKHQPKVFIPPYDEFLSHLEFKAQTQNNLRALHKSFVKAQKAGAFKKLSTDDAYKVLNLLADHIDSVCLHSATREIISNLATNLQQLYSALPERVVEELKTSGKWDHFVCRMLSFQGNFNMAATMIKKLAGRPNKPFRDAYDSYLLALSRYRSLASALRFWTKPELKGLLHLTSKFGKLASTDGRLKAAVREMALWPDKSRSTQALQYLLKMAVLNKNTAAALVIIERMNKMGVEPFFEHVLSICKFLAAERNLSRAKELFNTIRPTDQQFYSQTKLYLYARSGDTAATFKLLEERKASGHFQIEDRSNVLLALSTAKRFDEMKAFFETSYPTSIDGLRSPKPPLVQYSICLLAHARAGNVENVEWWFNDMDKQGVKPNVHIFTHLLTLFKKLGNDRSLMYAFNQMLQSNIRPDPSLYTLMLSHFAQRNNSNAADALYLDAIKQGVVPDEKMTSALLNAHIQSGSWQEAYRIFRHLSSRLGPHKPLLSVYNTMYKAHLLLGAPFKVMTRLFLLIKQLGFQPNEFTYSILMMSACEAGQLTLATEILEEIKEEQIEQRRTDLLNTQIMTILMSGFLRFNDKVNAKKVLDEMVSLGLQPTEITYATIIKAYGSSRLQSDMEQAEKFVKKLIESPQVHLDHSKSRKQPIANLYLPLMAVPSENGNTAEVERLYEEFLEAGGRPTIAVYHRLLLAYQRADQIRKAVNLWPLIEELAERDNLLAGPPAEAEDENDHIQLADIQLPLSIYLDILSKFGMHVEVANIWFKLQKRGFKFDTHNWNHLVVILIRAGQINRAFEVMERVLLPNERANTLNMRIATRSRKVQGVKASEKPDPLDHYLRVPQGNPLWGSEDRIEVAALSSYKRGRLRAQAIDISQLDKDFVYPMRVLEFIRPTWNDWRPHTVIWRTLLIVWLQLENNFVPKPLESGGELIHNVTVPDISDRDPGAAEEMMVKLRQQYPKTARRIRAFSREERKRLSKKDFERLYTQH